VSNLLQLQEGSKAYGAKLLFDRATFAINEGEHVGVIGPNGAGKTTLFKILTQQESLDKGEVTRSKSLRVGYLAQHDNWGAEETVEQYLSKDCVTPLWELKSLAQGLGLSEDFFSRPILSLSGGYRMRCKLLYLIGQEPNLMLLDEPTNYLDLETLMVLENFLQNYKGAFLLISHDREFLRRTADHILEIESAEVIKFNGTIEDYFEQKEMLRAQLQARAMSLQEKRKEILDFVARFGAKATKASQAQSRLKMLDRMEQIELKPLPVNAAIHLPPPMKTGKLILNLKGCSLGYAADHSSDYSPDHNKKIVLKDVRFMLQNGDHLAVVGLNGAGKSTLLKALAGLLAPLSGELETGYQVSIGYFAQHVAEGLNSSDTVFDAMARDAHPDVTRQEVLNLAGSLLFHGDEVQKRIAVLSGGEKARVAMGRILLQRCPCLILDEPTNHLDFQTVEVLTQALVKYPGTVVVVSHDRSFVRRVGTKILEIRNGSVELYHGTYDDYVWSVQKGALSQRKEPAPKTAVKSSSAPVSATATASTGDIHGGNYPNNPNYKDTKKALDKLLRQAERRLEEIDRVLPAHQEKLHLLSEKITRSVGLEFQALIKEMSEIQAVIDSLESDWLTMSEQKDRAETQIRALTGT
jgi:ATP-binding cassette subfamily F protein 3